MNDEQTALLRKVTETHAPDQLPLLSIVGKRELKSEERQSLRMALLRELAIQGLDEHDEPTPYGLRLEALITFLGHV